MLRQILGCSTEKVREHAKLGGLIAAFVVEVKNGQMTDLTMDGEHLFNLTNRKHIGLYDVVEEKKLASFFNDYRTS